ncbi:oxygenase MpaB family protein [Mycolicibacterium sp. CR10]|uniref:oxygenase MpaB family protein n=1 Tax=Mycolicibacterium sp. CR10 TaxID=2562314 RepID=UPI0010C0C6DA|nr:oxygenase MpaB family protein [Mycolicibacterium sp. CR10]
MTVSGSVRAQVPQVERAVSDADVRVRPRKSRSAGADDGMLGLGLLAGPANVIMQLARPGVGYGVVESRVERGRVDRHPIKRARTTFTYLAVSTNGTEEQKAAFRRAVDGAHAQVYSTETSPVEYTAFDKDLQLWVGACLYKGVVDVHRLFVGEMDEETAERLYVKGRALATMLQVPENMWPTDRAAFDRYWQDSLAKVHIDDTVRDYLYPIAASRLRGVTLPGPVQRRAEKLALLITTGFLPQRFRDEMRLPWGPAKQRRFDRLMGVLRVVNTVSPKFVRQFPFNVLLKDVDWRIRTGRPLV